MKSDRAAMASALLLFGPVFYQPDLSVGLAAAAEKTQCCVEPNVAY